jgi:drug/metabolite transporter (DMT)-like permease
VINSEYDMRPVAKNLLILFVLGAVGLNLLAAVAMKVLANQTELGYIFFLLGVGFVIFLNGLRLVVWMFANKRFPLSTMYPLTSIFYPLMLGVSYFFGEKITAFQILGTFLITSGVFWLGWRIKDEAI